MTNLSLVFVGEEALDCDEDEELAGIPDVVGCGSLLSPESALSPIFSQSIVCIAFDRTSETIV